MMIPFLRQSIYNNEHVELANEIPAHSILHRFDRRRGSYLESGISRSWETEPVVIAVGVHFGSNFGYVADGHHEPDHIVVSAKLSREVFESLTLRVRYACHFAIDRNPIRHAGDAELHDGSLFGVSAEYSF